MKSVINKIGIAGEHFYEILEYYNDIPEIYAEIKDYIEQNSIEKNEDDYDLVLFNRLINWIEENLGEANVKSAGRRMFKKFFDYRNEKMPLTSANDLLKIGSELNEFFKDKALKIEIKSEKDLLKIKSVSGMNKKFQSGLIEEFLSRISNFYYIRKVVDNQEINKKDLILVYKAIQI